MAALAAVHQRCLRPPLSHLNTATRVGEGKVCDKEGAGSCCHLFVLQRMKYDCTLQEGHLVAKLYDSADGMIDGMSWLALHADCEGHGTHVAAVVGGLTYGVAKDATLHAVRILDCEGNGAGGQPGEALTLLKPCISAPLVVY